MNEIDLPGYVGLASNKSGVGGAGAPSARFEGRLTLYDYCSNPHTRASDITRPQT